MTRSTPLILPLQLLLFLPLFICSSSLSLKENFDSSALPGRKDPIMKGTAPLR
ncbi:hypothetical protein P153DRAFT_367432 [Dothidotthia symphoricarpi CBS 119687]|uniref:Uncharacterized protein n=1 Tax=Dothidotthia symphoricarpi CBS 119687 TaxID=1392245 RepID=A0A6A6ADI6_9PLEO|nr:uncharacterized protein P153DRAFT_367432 [Dothidotthia symphoricarpi CBS 119687]KAF2129185.1 hypothetical protein P153DRAFT_367432 [Dothidotthia symphoricarpi CBS 119687]